MSFKQLPLVRFVIPFVLGIILAIYHGFSLNIVLGIFFICFLVYIIEVIISARKVFYNRHYFLTDFLLYVCLFLGGILLVIFHTDLNYKDHFHYQDQNNAVYIVEVISPIHIKPKSVQCEVEVKKMTYNDKIVLTNGKALAYFEKTNLSLDLLPGDLLQLNTNWKTIKPASNPSQFNYKLFLQFHQIYDQAYINKDNWELLSRNHYSVFSISNRCRNHFLNLFRQAGIENQEFAVATALTLGYKDELNNKIKHAYSSAGAMHVLAVSGLHVGIIYLIFNGVLSFLFRYRRAVIIKTAIILFLIWAYALLTGFSPSVLRATTMLSFIIIGNTSGRNANIYNSLAASAFFLLMIDPYLIMQVGFQLSYLAVIGIVFFQPRIYKRLKFKNKILDYIWSITAVSIAAQLITFPLGLLYFHQFPSYFLISNLLVIPAAFLMLILGILLLLTSICFPISNAIGWLMNLVVETVNTAVIYIDDLPFSLIEGISISIKETYLIYLVVIFIGLGFSLRRFRLINYSLISLLLLFLLDLHEDYNLINKKQLVIYDVKGHIAIDFIVGKEHLFLSSEELYNDEASMLFNIKHHWYDLDLSQPVFKRINSDNNLLLSNENDTLISINNNRFSYGGIDLVLLDSSYCKPIDNSSVILLSGKYEGDYIELINKNINNKFIGMSDLSYQQRSELESLTKQLDVSYYDVSKEGAWILDL